MNARMFASREPIVAEPRSAVVFDDVDHFRAEVASHEQPAPRVHDWDQEMPLTRTVIDIALGQAEQSDLDFVREAARIARRELEARLPDRSAR